MKPYTYIGIFLSILWGSSASFAHHPTSGFNGIVINSIDKTEEVCDLSNGTLTIHASGGNAALLYSIDGGTTYQSSNFFDGLTNIDYHIIVADGLGCSTPFSTQIGSAPPQK